MVEAKDGLCIISYHGGYTDYSTHSNDDSSVGVIVINNDSTIFETEGSGLYLVSRSESMSLFSFRASQAGGGSSVEFPLLLFLVIPLACLMI